MKFEDKKIVDPALYSRDYFLSDNEGFDEHKAGLDKKMHSKFELVLRHAAPNKGDSVLDIGCGRGELIYYCAKRGAKVLGIDYSQAAIAITKETIKRLPIDLQNIAIADVGEAATYKFPDSYDIVYMIEVAEHMYDWQLIDTFKKIHEHLKTDGRLMITTPNLLYENLLSPLKRVVNIPFNLIKWVLRIMRGKYKKKDVLLGLKKVFRLIPGRGESGKQMHVNIMTPGKLKKLLSGFKVSIICEDPSKNVLSILTRKWCGRSMIVIARKE